MQHYNCELAAVCEEVTIDSGVLECTTSRFCEFPDSVVSHVVEVKCEKNVYLVAVAAIHSRAQPGGELESFVLVDAAPLN